MQTVPLRVHDRGFFSVLPAHMQFEGAHQRPRAQMTLVVCSLTQFLPPDRDLARGVHVYTSQHPVRDCSSLRTLPLPGQCSVDDYRYPRAEKRVPRRVLFCLSICFHFFQNRRQFSHQNKSGYLMFVQSR